MYGRQRLVLNQATIITNLISCFRQKHCLSEFAPGIQVQYTASVRNSEMHSLVYSSQSRTFVTTFIQKSSLLTECIKMSNAINKEIGFAEYEKLQKSGLFVIDVRDSNEVKATGTIPGSLNIPLKQIDYALSMSEEDFKAKYGISKPGENKPLMFLCQRGIRSRKAMILAIQLGYSNALSYNGGWEDFRKLFSKKMPNANESFRHVDYTDVLDFISLKKHLIIDVREKNELEETGIIPGSYNIPLGEIDKALMSPDEEFKDTYNFSKPSLTDEIVFTCRSGKRSLVALEKAIACGFTNSMHYKGGWLDWEKKTSKEIQ